MNEYGERENESNIKVWVVTLGKWLGMGGRGRTKFDFDGLRWVGVFNGAIDKNRGIKRMKDQEGRDTR